MLNEIKNAGKIAVASDHAGYKTKEMVKGVLKQSGYDFTDFGTNNEDSVDYPDFAFKVAESVSGGEYQKGILICGTGLGMCIAANKIKGVRAVTPYDKFTAEMSRQHNDANILCLGARALKENDIREIVKIWLETPFDTGNPRHQRRIQKISGYQAK
ncbi:MAG: ribose 5-phosphate isomerase B [Planctomycetes bacterium]|nr:ribose 5-phosphate isomerase B [Planctomycetota bacterium]